MNTKKIVSIIVSVVLVFTVTVVAIASNSLNSDKVETVEQHTFENTYSKLITENKLNIGYIGGSITAGAGAEYIKYAWASVVTEWFEATFPNATIASNNVGIGSTGSVFGQYRVVDDLNLTSETEKPDLIFIDFAINDAYDDTSAEDAKKYMHSVLNSIYENAPEADVIILLTTDGDKAEEANETEAAHIEVAETWGVPVLDIGGMIWEDMTELAGGNAKDVWYEYFQDNVHPNNLGHLKYASYITYYLDTVFSKKTETKAITNHKKPDGADEVFGTPLVNPHTVNFENQEVPAGFDIDEYGILYAYSPASFKVEFSGTSLALWTFRDTNCGYLEVSIDGEEAVKFDMRNSYDYPAIRLVKDGLEDTTHIAEISVSETSVGSYLRIYRLCLTGGTSQDASIIPSTDPTNMIDTFDAFTQSSWKLGSGITAADVRLGYSVTANEGSVKDKALVIAGTANGVSNAVKNTLIRKIDSPEGDRFLELVFGGNYNIVDNVGLNSWGAGIVTRAATDENGNLVGGYLLLPKMCKDNWYDTAEKIYCYKILSDGTLSQIGEAVDISSIGCANAVKYRLQLTVTDESDSTTLSWKLWKFEGNFWYEKISGSFTDSDLASNGHFGNKSGVSIMSTSGYTPKIDIYRFTDDVITDDTTSTGRTLKVLAIGNSFSQDGVEWIYPIATELGAEEVIIGNMYYGGCSLEMHLNWATQNPPGAYYDYEKRVSSTKTVTSSTSLETALRDEDWDYITLQQASPGSGRLDTITPYLGDLVSYIKDIAEEEGYTPKFGWHMTWAYQSDCTQSAFADYYNSDQEYMYDAIVNVAQNVAGSFDVLIPTGTAIQNVRNTSVGDTLTRDGYHLSYNLGRYIAGLTWVKAITGWDISDIEYTPNADEVPVELIPTLVGCVNNAVENPYEVTQIQN